LYFQHNNRNLNRHTAAKILFRKVTQSRHELL
jgi:hypothetical protein